MWRPCGHIARRHCPVSSSSSSIAWTGQAPVLCHAESSAMGRQRAGARCAIKMVQMVSTTAARHGQSELTEADETVRGTELDGSLVDGGRSRSKGRSSSRKQRATEITSGRTQKTINYNDLPMYALDAKGQPRTPLPPMERRTGRSHRHMAEQAKSMQEDDRADGERRAGQNTPVSATDSSDRTSSSLSYAHPRIHERGPEDQEWPPLAKDVLTNMARFSSCILLTRVGGFYESYFEQAPVLANLLGIKLASRLWGGRTVPMAGFPIVQVEKYLKILVMDHRRLVAICDEFKDIRSDGAQAATAAGGRSRVASPRMQAPFAPSINARLGQAERIEISRRVTRVVSPGTLIDEAFLDPFASNWILSVGKVGDEYGVAWLDVSTADFHTTICTDEQSLRDEVARIAPSEVVLERGVFDRSSKVGLENFDGSVLSPAYKAADFGRSSPFVPNDSVLWEALDPATVHVSFLNSTSLPSPNSPDAQTDAESAAVTNLTVHLKTRLIEIDMQGVEDLTGQAEGPHRRRRDRVLTMDASTLSALEINASMRREEQSFNPLSMTLSARGSLLSHVRRTVTKGGARLLAQWLTAPSTSLAVIQRRQALVALILAESSGMTEDLRGMLRRRAGDINRALQRIITSRNDEQDLLEVRDFVQLCQDIVSHLRDELEQHGRSMGEAAPDDLEASGWQALEMVANTFEDISNLGRRLGEAIDEGVIDKRLRLLEDRARELEAGVLGEEAKLASGDEERGRASRQKASSARASDGEEDGDGEDKLWGPRFEHLIHPGASPQIAALTREHTLLRRRAYKLESGLRHRFSERLSLRFLLGQGYVVHLSDVREGMQQTLVEMEAEMSLAYKSKTTRTFYHEQFTRIGSRLGRVELDLQEKEAIELQRLRLDVIVELGRLRQNASLMHELDVLIGFATLARELNLVRPNIHEGTGLRIKDGRHIGVELALLHQERQAQLQYGNSVVDEAVLSRRFTPNDIDIGDETKLHLITGPNMGGKSTLLRMVAIIAILAQTGSFVPAGSCDMGIVDQIFSRIGAHDAIHADKSTFMIEMLEVGQFLRRSTDRSLVLCDEVGRGTDHETGIAIAHATAMHLVDAIGCKCLFATHLHDVGDMLRNNSGVAFFCTDLEESHDGGVIFSHKLRPGLNRTSHGLTIARLANLPDKVLEQARKTLSGLQGGNDRRARL